MGDAIIIETRDTSSVYRFVESAIDFPSGVDVILPGPVPVKIILAIVLSLIIVWLLVTDAFPARAPSMQFNDVTVDGH